MHGLGTIVTMTLHEARRRRILVGLVIFGLAFVALFSIGFHFIAREVGKSGQTFVENRAMLNFFVMAGLYVVNFLAIMAAVLMPIDTLSGEIASGVMQTVASKPINRPTIVLGKWMAYAIVLAGYLVFMAGGILISASVQSGVTPPHIERGLALMALEDLVLMTLCIASGTRFSTITNGVIVFGLYGIALVGSWTEQIGALANNDSARYVGMVASLIMPSESMWQLAAWNMQPSIVRDLRITPFSVASVPNGMMVAWAVGYVLVWLWVAMRGLSKRGL